MIIKLVAFDLDDCLFDSTGLSKRARIKGIDAMLNLGLKIKRKKAIKILMEIVEEYGSNFSKHYNYFIRRLNQVYDQFDISFNMKYKLISAAVMAYHKEKIDSIKLYNDVVPTLRKLIDKDIRTAIITDGIPIKQWEKILRLDIDELIEMVIISDQIGVRKPNPWLFEFCLNQFGVKGEETIYIGDRIERDIVPAKKNSINSIYIHRGGKYDLYQKTNNLPKSKTPDFEINNLNEIFKIIDTLNHKID